LYPADGFKLRSILKPVTCTFESFHAKVMRVLAVATAATELGVFIAASALVLAHASPSTIAIVVSVFRICMRNLPRNGLVTCWGRDPVSLWK
jgi:hypothetical protein